MVAVNNLPSPSRDRPPGAARGAGVRMSLFLRLFLRLSVYRLWQLARVHYSPLSQAAVHEFLKGQRQLELPSVEALLTALDLRVVRKNTRSARKANSRTK